MNQPEPKCYSIIPAAGRSRRMGRQKLLLPWPCADPDSDIQAQNHTVLEQVLSTWQGSNVDEVVLVLREGTEDNTEEANNGIRIAKLCSKYNVHVVYADDPPDMKASVLRGIQFLQEKFSPTEIDRCFVSPADLPSLTSKIVNELARQPAQSSEIILPFFGEKRSHPVLLPWNLLLRANSLGADQGINTIVDQNNFTKIQFPIEEMVSDIDTMEEYEVQFKRFLGK